MPTVEEAAKQLRIDFHDTFTTEAGDRVLKHLMQSCHYAEGTFVQGEPDTTAFQEGRRDVILLIMGLVTDLTDYTALMKELQDVRGNTGDGYQFPHQRDDGGLDILGGGVPK